MHIVLITKRGHEDTGIGRHSSELIGAMEALGHRVNIVHPIVPLPGWLIRAVRRLLGWDLGEFFNNYPLWAEYPAGNIYHLSGQSLATLLLLHRPLGTVVVTSTTLSPG
jgi:hypothetical protein